MSRAVRVKQADATHAPGRNVAVQRGVGRSVTAAHQIDTDGSLKCAKLSQR